MTKFKIIYFLVVILIAVSVYLVFAVPPDLSLIYPTNTTYNINVSNLNYTVQNTSTFCMYYVGGLNVSVTCGINITGLTSNEGSQTWIVYANDSLGNQNTSQITFFKDTIFPQINLTFPLNISYNLNISSLNYTISDTNLQACWYSINNGVTNISVTCGINITGLTSNEGSQTWLIAGNDTANNLNLSRATFFKDSIKPNVIINSPLATDYTYLTLDINISTNENSTCIYSKAGSGNQTLNRNNSDTGFSITDTFKEGSNTLYAYCNDTLNNLNNSASVIFNVYLSAGFGGGSGGGVPKIDTNITNITGNLTEANLNQQQKFKSAFKSFMVISIIFLILIFWKRLNI